MKIIENQIRPHHPAGRSVEIPFIKDMLCDVKNSYIADFGCMNGPTNNKRIGTGKYNLDTSNKFEYFDLQNVPKIKGKYNRVDLSTKGFFNSNVFDYGICVSVVEHIGLSMHGNKNVVGADIAAISNMYDTIKPNGTLYITVPASDTYQLPLHWVKSYTPQMIKDWGKGLTNPTIKIKLCKYVAPNWYECNEEEFINIKQYSNKHCIIGIACVTIKKG